MTGSSATPYRSHKQRLNDWNSTWRMWEKPETYHRVRGVLYEILDGLIYVWGEQYPSISDLRDDLTYFLNNALEGLEKDGDADPLRFTFTAVPHVWYSDFRDGAELRLGGAYVPKDFEKVMDRRVRVTVEEITEG